MWFWHHCLKSFTKQRGILRSSYEKVQKLIKSIMPQNVSLDMWNAVFAIPPESFCEKAEKPTSYSGNNAENLAFSIKIFRNIFLWTRKFRSWEHCCRKIFTKNLGMIERKSMTKMSSLQKVPLYRLKAVLRNLLEVFHQKAETFWLNFRERYLKYYFFKKNYSSNVPLDTYIDLLRALKLFLQIP